MASIRYNATRCLRYFMDATRVREDLQTLLVKCPLLQKSFEEAGGVDEVYRRVFTLEHYKKDLRLLLQLAVKNNNVTIFQQLLSELERENMDLTVLVHASKQYPSLLEFAVNNHCLSLASYLLQTYSFREREILSAYKLLAVQFNNLNIMQLHTRQSSTPRMMAFVQNNNGRVSNPVELYTSMIALIDLIPVVHKAKVLEILLRTLFSTPRPAVLQEIISHIPEGATELSEYDQVVEEVIKNDNDHAMQTLIECFGLRARLMHEDARGHTVVDAVMDKYVEKVRVNQAVRPVCRDDEGEADKKRQEQMAMFATTEKKKKLAELEEKLLPGKNSIARMLKLVLEGAHGQSRVLTTTSAVQKRVKRESRQAAEATFRGRRRCIQQSGPDAEYQYKTNIRMQIATNLCEAVIKEHKE